MRLHRAFPAEPGDLAKATPVHSALLCSRCRRRGCLLSSVGLVLQQGSLDMLGCYAVLVCLFYWSLCVLWQGW